jgi:ribosome maturation factor RimP
MLKEESIRQVVEDFIRNKNIFIVDVIIKSGNKLLIYVDSPDNISLLNCAEINRHIADFLEKENEDFEVEVSSPGLEQSFKVLKQFEKYIGKQIEVITHDGIKRIAKLAAFTEKGIEIEETKKIKIIGTKKKQETVNKLWIEFNQIKSTKAIYTFK